MPLEDIFAPSREYFQGLQQARTQQAYMRQLQQQQRLKDAIELFKATRTPPTKPIYDAKRGVLIDPNTGKVTNLGLPAASGGGGGKLNPDYARAMAENGLNDVSQVTPMMLFKAHQGNMQDASTLIAGRTPPQIVEVPGYDPMGRPTQTPYRVGKRGGEATPVLTAPPTGAPPSAAPQPLVGKKMSGMESRSIATVQSIMPQLTDLRSRMEAIGPERWNRNILQRQLDYRKAKDLNILPEDPELASLTSQLIQVETNAKAALLASANTRAYGFIQGSAGHIPTAYGDYNSILTNIDTLMAPSGPYASLLKAYELGQLGGEGGGAVPKTQSLSDRGYVKLPDGTWYNPTTNKYDDGK